MWPEIATIANFGYNALRGDGGAGKASSAASAAQMRLANIMGDTYQKQAGMDLPFRQDLFGALRDRAARTTPRFMPGKMPTINPYRNVNRMSPQRTQGQTQTGRGPTLANAIRSRLIPETSQRRYLQNEAANSRVAGYNPFGWRSSGMSRGGRYVSPLGQGGSLGVNNRQTGYGHPIGDGGAGEGTGTAPLYYRGNTGLGARPGMYGLPRGWNPQTGFDANTEGLNRSGSPVRVRR